MLDLAHNQSARTLLKAATLAVRKGTDLANIMLVNGLVIGFRIADVLDDGIIGARTDKPEAACLIPWHAVAMIEFSA